MIRSGDPIQILSTQAYYCHDCRKGGFSLPSKNLFVIVYLCYWSYARFEPRGNLITIFKCLNTYHHAINGNVNPYKMSTLFVYFPWLLRNTVGFVCHYISCTQLVIQEWLALYCYRKFSSFYRTICSIQYQEYFTQSNAESNAERYSILRYL